MYNSNHNKSKKIAIIQPIIPHFRKEFLSWIHSLHETDIFLYEDMNQASKNCFDISSIPYRNIPNFQIKGILIYNPISLFNGHYDTLVLMLHFAHLTTWILLLTKFLHRKRIILWGQGISVKRYLQEEKHPDWKLKWMMKLADGAWIYTEKEAKLWKNIFPHKPIVALNNTISQVDTLVKQQSVENKEVLKSRYDIKEERILIFCARFENPYRRIDLLINTIEKLDKKRFGYIIIGDGKLKPDFSAYPNVHDFGKLYDEKIKSDLFAIADIYFQPGWVGLSIVEAMAYGKPIFTFKRTEETKQCVEYAYIIPHYNGIIFENMEECIKQITHLSDSEIQTLGRNALEYAQQHLSMKHMVTQALSNLS
jgi:glycosyltransferase involved in cell wall biosynthesis